MIEKWKYLFLVGAAVWAVFFAVISILMFTLESIPWLSWILEWILAAVIGYFVTRMVLKKYGGGMIDGLKYGAILLGITLLFDLAITAPWFAGGYVKFLSNWVMWVGIAISLVAAAFAGKQNQSQPQQSPPQTPPPTPGPNLNQQQ